MTDIPDEIMQRARALWLEIHGYSKTAATPIHAIARALMEARAAGYAVAREQAAKVARRYRETWANAGGFHDHATAAKIIGDTIEAMKDKSDE